jgi:hypothetical protein
LLLARRVTERREHLLVTQLAQPHVVFHDGVAARVAMGCARAVEDPLGHVPLFLGLVLILFENGVDHAQPRTSLGHAGCFLRR